MQNRREDESTKSKTKSTNIDNSSVDWLCASRKTISIIQERSLESPQGALTHCKNGYLNYTKSVNENVTYNGRYEENR